MHAFGDKVTVELVAGGGGVFEVTGDDNLLFSKRGEGRFPEAGEVVAVVQQMI